MQFSVLPKFLYIWSIVDLYFLLKPKKVLCSFLVIVIKCQRKAKEEFWFIVSKVPMEVQLDPLVGLEVSQNMSMDMAEAIPPWQPGCRKTGRGQGQEEPFQSTFASPTTQ